MPEHETPFFKQYVLPALLGGLALLVVGGLAYLAGWQGITRPDGQLEVAITAAAPPLPGTPVARYFQLDPAVIDYLNSVPYENVAPPPVNENGLPPLGAYLPRTGNVGIRLDATPAPLPTPRPYLTGTPFPLPSVPPAPTAIPSPVPVTEPAPTIAPAVAAAPVLPPNAECAPSGLPVSGLLTQYFHTYHVGIDLGAPLGSPVYATHTGKVIFADWSNIGYGYLVIIRNGAFITYYAHNTSLNVVADQEVSKGSIIAWSGSTGNSTGPHVHYETRINDVPVDPLTFEDRGYASC